MKLAPARSAVPGLIVRLAVALLTVAGTATTALAGGGDMPQDGQSYGSVNGPNPVALMRRYEEGHPENKTNADVTYPKGMTAYGKNGETKDKKQFPTIPGKIWPIVTMPYQPQGPEKMANWAKVMDEITGYSQKPQIGEVNLSPAFCALAMANAGQMLADELQSPQAAMPRAREEQNQQVQQSADNCAAMERQQAGCAIDFVASYLNNFTVDGGNKWNQVRNQLFLPMALLLLLPGAVLSQVKSIVSQGFPVLGEISPWDGLFRSIVSIFLIPATYLVVNYGIDLANSITFTIADQYQKIFGTDMYEDAMCAHIRAFPFREPSENKNYVPNQEAKMSKLSPNNTPFANLEGKMIDVKLLDPCAGLNIVPPDRANEQVKYSVNAQRNAYNQANAALAMTWNILCAFQMAYLYYLWFVGPVVAALWVYPMKQLRDAFPSWCEGVLTLCFWSLFWNTVVLLQACFRGVDDTGTIMMTALNFLATACVKFAFDFAGLVKDAGREAAKVAEKMSHGGGGNKGGHPNHNASHNNNHHHGGNPNPAPAPGGLNGHGGGAGGAGGLGAPGSDGTLASGGLDGLGAGAGGVAEGAAGTMNGAASGVSGAVDMTGFPAPPTHGHSHFGAGLGTGLGIGLGAGALLGGAIELAHHHAHHNPFGNAAHPGVKNGEGVAGTGNGAGGNAGESGATGGRGIDAPGGGMVDAGGVDAPGTTFNMAFDGDEHQGDDYNITHDIDFGTNAALAATGDLPVDPKGLPPLSTPNIPLTLNPGETSNLPGGASLPPSAIVDTSVGGAGGPGGPGGAGGPAGQGGLPVAGGDHLHAPAHPHAGGGHGGAHPHDLVAMNHGAGAGHGHGHAAGPGEHGAAGGHGHGHGIHAAMGGHGLHPDHHAPGHGHGDSGHGHERHGTGHGGGHGHGHHEQGNNLVAMNNANANAFGAVVGGQNGPNVSGQDVPQSVRDDITSRQMAAAQQQQQQADAMRDLYRDAQQQQQQYQQQYQQQFQQQYQQQYQDQYGQQSAFGTGSGVNSSYVDYNVTASMIPNGTGGVDYTAAPSGYSTGSGSGSNSFTTDPGYLTASSSSGSSGYDPSAATFNEMARSVSSDNSTAGSILDGSGAGASGMGSVAANSDYSTMSTFGSNGGSSTDYASSSSTDYSSSSSYDNTSSSSSYSYDNTSSSIDYSTTSYNNTTSSSSDYSMYSNNDSVGNTPIIDSQLPSAGNTTSASGTDYSSSQSAPPVGSSSYDSSFANMSPSGYSGGGGMPQDVSAQITASQQQDVAAQANALQAAGYNAPPPDNGASMQMPANVSFNGNNGAQTPSSDNWSQMSTPNHERVSMNVDNYNTNNNSSAHNYNQNQPSLEARINADPAAAQQPLQPGAAQVAGAAAMFAAGIHNAAGKQVNADARRQAPMNPAGKQVKPTTPPGGSMARGAGIPGGGKQSRMGQALGRAGGGKPQADPKGRPNGNQAPKPSSGNQARKSVANPLSIDSGNTLRRYKQARKMTPEELAELENSARDSGDWLSC